MAAAPLRILQKVANRNLLPERKEIIHRHATTTASGAVLPDPEKVPFGLLGLVLAVVPGLLIGATISKKIANFLEENDLFVPSDDDDDDD